MASEPDLFEDFQNYDGAQFESLATIYKPVVRPQPVAPGQRPTGVMVTYHCATCAREEQAHISFAELYCVAHGLLPNECGIQDVWQRDAQRLSFGPALKCRACMREEASFMFGIEEAKRILAQNDPIVRADATVRQIAPRVQQVLQVLQQQRAAQQGQGLR